MYVKRDVLCTFVIFFEFPDEFASKPFFGVPFTTKDSTSVCGKLHTLGLLSRRGTIAKEDAECVALAKKAGAIILGNVGTLSSISIVLSTILLLVWN